MTSGARGTPPGRRPALDVGLFIVAGAAIGTLLLAITGDALWLAIGPALGVLAAGLLGIQRGRSSRP